ncbi:MAG TPA: hypothetical protein VGN70_03420 [Gammaproteobacteria bacterium]|jgi:hypothetical protein
MNRPATALLALAAAIALLGVSSAARADDDQGLGEFLNEYNVYSPYVTEGQSEIELRATQYRDSSVLVDGSRGYVVSFAHAFTSWWQPEVYVGKYQRDPRGPNQLTGYEFENIFQITPQGEYFADFGFLASYEYQSHLSSANALEYGPLIEMHTGRIRQRLNLIYEKGVGRLREDNGVEYRGAYNVSFLWTGSFAPGIDVFAHPQTDVYQAGPSASGELHIGSSELEYDAGVVFKLGSKGPDTTLVMRLEYEFF